MLLTRAVSSGHIAHHQKARRLRTDEQVFGRDNAHPRLPDLRIFRQPARFDLPGGQAIGQRQGQARPALRIGDDIGLPERRIGEVLADAEDILAAAAAHPPGHRQEPAPSMAAVRPVPTYSGWRL